MSSSQQLLLGEGAGGGAVVANYIEEVFSTWLYTGNGTDQTINNGIDLSTKGGMVWFKARSSAVNNTVVDTVRGGTNELSTNLTAAQLSGGGGTAFTTTGFTLENSGSYYANNQLNVTYASWTFRKQPKFFDVVTYTGDGFGSRDVAHNLGSVPGFILIKRTDSTSPWGVWHRGDGVSAVTYFSFNTTASGATDASYTSFTSATTFVVDGIGPTSGSLNINGASYVAYIFAHDAGGFGLTGTDNVISCGSYTGDGTTNWSKNITLGYEPQWVLIRRTSATGGNWFLVDTMRGMPVNANSEYLRPNLSNAEANTPVASPTATGFTVANTNTNNSGDTYIYIAIRRGPMKVPTLGTTVFTPIAATPSAGATANIAVTPDMFLFKGRTINDPFWTEDRLRFFAQANTSSAKQLQVNSSSAEVTQLPLAYYIQNARMLWGGYLDGATSIIYNFKRAPSFFDEVCYTGTFSATTLTHNLGVAPELIITKARSSTSAWAVYASSLGNNKALFVNTIDPVTTTSTYWNSTTPTSSVFSLGFSAVTNSSGITYVAYLFATAAGVSKVGSYTGTGSTQTISCGFTGGARFVMIKCTNVDGDWWVWDTARGMVSGNDRRLGLNLQTAEQNADWVYTTTGGFQIVTSDAGVNASGNNYIFLAIA